MANRPLGIRVPEAERPAWERVLTLARDLGPEEAARRLQGEPGAGAHATAPPAPPRETAWPEKRLIAALGRRGPEIRQQAQDWLREHDLPDTAENRVAAMLDRLEACADQAVQEFGEADRLRRELAREVTALRGEWRRLDEEGRKARAAAATAGADLAAARQKAGQEWEAEYDGRMRQLQLEGYLPDELAGVVEAARAEGLNAAALPRLVALVRQVGGPLRAIEEARRAARTWEDYVAHLRSEVEGTLTMARLEAGAERLRAAQERATTYTGAGLGSGARHLSLQELRRMFAALSAGRSDRPAP